MLPTHRIPAHPGANLQKHYLVPRKLTAKNLADKTGIPIEEIEELLDCKRPVTAPIAWALSMAFDTTPQLWLNMQNSHDLCANRPKAKFEPFPRPVYEEAGEEVGA